MPTDDLRTRLKALVEEWRAVVTKADRAFGFRTLSAASVGGCADQLSALLAESEPHPGKTHYQGDDCPGGHASVCGYCGAPCEACNEATEADLLAWEAEQDERETQPVLKLGHEFMEAQHSEACCIAPGKCHGVVGMGLCKQPREAH